MLVLNVWHWRWGDKGFCIWDFSKPDVKEHALKCVEADKEKRDIVHQEFYLVTEIFRDKLKEIS